MDVLIINGPNLNMLGIREPKKYGIKKYVDIQKEVTAYALTHNIYTDFYQSNYEGEIIETIHKSTKYDHLILNLGGLTHTSISIRDALLSVKSEFIEVHLSNIFAREEFRHTSYISDIAIGIISGFKEYSYYLAIDYLVHLSKKEVK